MTGPPPEPHAAVARGAAAIEAHRPGALARLDPAAIDCGSTRACPLALAFGGFKGYEKGAVALKLEAPGQLAAHGFAAIVGVSMPELDEAWRAEIRRRRESRKGNRS